MRERLAFFYSCCNIGYEIECICYIIKKKCCGIRACCSEKTSSLTLRVCVAARFRVGVLGGTEGGREGGAYGLVEDDVRDAELLGRGSETLI